MISDMIWEVDRKLWHQLTEAIKSFYDSKGSKRPHGKLQCKNLCQANKVMHAFNQKYSRSMRYEGSIKDEWGKNRWAPLWTEKTATSEKEEKTRIMKCM
eukprot:7525435-Karenia_brevis.AAC.1